MRIQRLVIENFKSIERIELVDPNPFTVFVGPNGSGKSNIFEALEFIRYKTTIPRETVESLFGGVEKISRRSSQKIPDFIVQLDEVTLRNNARTVKGRNFPIEDWLDFKVDDYPPYKQFTNFARIFVKNEDLVKLKLLGNKQLTLSASNLEPVLKRILSDETLRNEIFEWLELFVPGFKAVEVDDRNELHWFEQSTPDYFTKDLISDGTYNILALLTAVYQSDDEPQFLCIEEPENGLHPQVAGELVDFFRIMCEERGHFIWLNTHSVSITSRVKPEEFILVEKKQGATTTRQFKAEDFHGLRTDEAWLTNLLNGGLAW